MIAAAGVSSDALDGDGQIAIAVRDQRRQSVDLVWRIRRRLDFNPAADAVENGFGIEGVGGIGRRHAAAFRGILTILHSRCAVAHLWTRSPNAGSPVKHINVRSATHGWGWRRPGSDTPGGCPGFRARLSTADCSRLRQFCPIPLASIPPPKSPISSPAL